MELVLIALSIFVIYTDIRYHKIPNNVTFPLIVGGLVYHSIISGWQGFTTAGIGFLLGVAIFIIPFMMGVMGAGDLKFAAGIGAALGPFGLYQAFIITAIAGGVFGICLLWKRGVLLRRLKTMLTAGIWFVGTKGKVRLSFDTDPRMTLPYGVFLSAGAILTVISKGVIY